MSEHIKIIYNGNEYELPVIVGSEGERAIDISQLRTQTGFITLDTGYANTGSCTSTITYINGEKGILHYRGIPVEQLAEQATFKETAYLLINGRLPNREELTRFSVLLNGKKVSMTPIGDCTALDRSIPDRRKRTLYRLRNARRGAGCGFRVSW